MTYKGKIELHKTIGNTTELVLVYYDGLVTSPARAEFEETIIELRDRRNAVDKWLKSILAFDNPNQTDPPEFNVKEELTRKPNEISLDIEIGSLAIKNEFNPTTKIYKMADRPAYEISFASLLYFVQELERFIKITQFNQWR